jgi:hypothetical protein
MRNLPRPHTARLLAVSIPSVSRTNRLLKGTLSPELRTRSLPIAHVRVGNCWSYNRSQLQLLILRLLNVTRQERALPSTTSADLRPADGDTCCTRRSIIASKRLRKKSGVLIGVARKLPERKSDRYCFWEFDNSQTSSHHSLALAPRSSEGATK